MEGVLVRVANDETMDGFFGNMVKGIIQAGAIPYLVYVSATDKEEIFDYALAPKGIKAEQVKWIQSGIDAFWSRDYGPWHVYVDGKRSIVDVKYYPTRAYDDAINGKLGKLWSENVYKAPLYIEGGNFMTDGKGTCWSSTGTFDFNAISPLHLASMYRAYLGCQKTYTPPPLFQEGTTHLDMFSKLLNQETILVGTTQAAWGALSEEIQSLNEIARYYESNTNVEGKPFKVVRIPMYFKNDPDLGRVYFAYTNSTIVNKTVLVPLYGLAGDAEALKIYQEQMPGYTVLGIEGGQDVIPWGGSVHCTTMQIPAKTPTDPGSMPTIATDSQSGEIKRGEWKFFGPYKAAAGDFKASMKGSGDADLYVWKDLGDGQRTPSNFACSPYEEGSFEECSVAGPGTFTVGVFGSSASNPFSLTIEYVK